MQVNHNNLEMTHKEDRLRFTNRGILSRTYSVDGEEFGLFFETSFGKSIVFKPTLARVGLKTIDFPKLVSKNNPNSSPSTEYVRLKMPRLVNLSLSSL